jgi:threonine 3-dehydrogenase
VKRVLITGVAGEVGSGLVRHLAHSGEYSITGFDLKLPSTETSDLCSSIAVGDIANSKLVSNLSEGQPFDTIFHLAGILSSGGERAPLKAHEVNVSGTLNILELARTHSEALGRPITAIFTSTIAVYGVASLAEKRRAGRVRECEFLNPITMYGANKLYCEALGRYYSENFGMLDDRSGRVRPDFRAVRFPGLLSAHTLPTGGTSDYAPEMVHAIARGAPYNCFVRPDARIPFMMMPDAARALVMLSEADGGGLTQRVYNIGGFAPSAREIFELLSDFFPSAKVDYGVHPTRQAIVDSWPEDIDDSAARRDFGWVPLYSFESGFADYLLPAAQARYAAPKTDKREFQVTTI